MLKCAQRCLCPGPKVLLHRPPAPCWAVSGKEKPRHHFSDAASETKAACKDPPPPQRADV